MLITLKACDNFQDRVYNIDNPDMVAFVKHLSARWEKANYKERKEWSDHLAKMEQKADMAKKEADDCKWLLDNVYNWEGPPPEPQAAQMWRDTVLRPLQQKIGELLGYLEEDPQPVAEIEPQF